MVKKRDFVRKLCVCHVSTRVAENSRMSRGFDLGVPSNPDSGFCSIDNDIIGFQFYPACSFFLSHDNLFFSPASETGEYD